MMHGPKEHPHKLYETPRGNMAKDKIQTEKVAAKRGRGVAEQKAGWALGLRQLYDSVVDEPLPDSFKDLLSKLDGADR